MMFKNDIVKLEITTDVPIPPEPPEPPVNYVTVGCVWFIDLPVELLIKIITLKQDIMTFIISTHLSGFTLHHIFLYTITQQLLPSSLDRKKAVLQHICSQSTQSEKDKVSVWLDMASICREMHALFQMNNWWQHAQRGELCNFMLLVVYSVNPNAMLCEVGERMGSYGIKKQTQVQQ